MYIILSYLLIFILLIFLFGLSAIMFLLFIKTYKNKVPFISVPKYILPYIERNFNLKDNSVVYDLGCGDARVLLFLAKNNTKAKYIGIENNPLPVLLAKIGSWINKIKTGNEVKILNQDFFQKDLSEATHIFVYLFPEIMDRLLPKFKKELKPGTIVISATFMFSDKQPIDEISLKVTKYRLVKRLYVYIF